VLPGQQMGTALWGDDATSQDVERPLELQREIIIEQHSRLLSRTLYGVARRLIHCPRRSLDNHLLAGANQARTLLPNAGQRGIELFLGLDSSREVAA
jgi:hypothetical protein